MTCDSCVSACCQLRCDRLLDLLQRRDRKRGGRQHHQREAECGERFLHGRTGRRRPSRRSVRAAPGRRRRGGPQWPLLRGRVQLLLQRGEAILDRRLVQRGELVVERLAARRVGRIQARVRAGVLQRDLVLELLEVLGRFLPPMPPGRWPRRPSPARFPAWPAGCSSVHSGRCGADACRRSAPSACRPTVRASSIRLRARHARLPRSTARRGPRGRALRHRTAARASRRPRTSSPCRRPHRACCAGSRPVLDLDQRILGTADAVVELPHDLPCVARRILYRIGRIVQQAFDRARNRVESDMKSSVVERRRVRAAVPLRAGSDPHEPADITPPVH